MPTTLEAPIKRYTADEYFELEKSSDTKHEFVNGQIIAMPGESKIANTIALNCAFEFRLMFKNTNLSVHALSVRLQVKEKNIYRYPDVAVCVAGDGDTHNILSPLLLVEVVSPSSEITDHSAKVREYCSLPTLQYYIIVSQDDCVVELYSRTNNGQWLYSFYLQLTDLLPLPLWSIELPLQTIYNGIEFGGAA
jgi:Uma2 family endonuclease